MTLKVLLLNLTPREKIVTSSNISIKLENIKNRSTLHDFHAIIIDTNEVLDPKYWGIYSTSHLNASKIVPDELRSEVKEQIETGGITFLFCGAEWITESAVGTYAGTVVYESISNYFCSPIHLGVKNDKGDTFNFNSENLKYFTPLIREIPREQISWECYFSELPENAKVLGVNRAGYTVFAEVPMENGRLVILPRFKDRYQAITLLIKEILPQIIHEDEPLFIPTWLSDFTSDLETKTRNLLSDIDKSKRLLYTEGKQLEKAVGLAFETMGFLVKTLPHGTNADLEIFDGDQKAVVEVKGHKKRQSDRKDVLQLLGYSTPEGEYVKGIFVTNHEYCKSPKERNNDGFKQGAIKLGIDTKLSLITTIELYEIVTNILEGKITKPKLAKIRKKIINGIGTVSLINS
jgi:hypothetical protein